MSDISHEEYKRKKNLLETCKMDALTEIKYKFLPEAKVPIRYGSKKGICA